MSQIRSGGYCIVAPRFLCSSERIHGPGSIVVRDGRFGEFDDEHFRSVETTHIPLEGCLVTAGLANAHTHLDLTFEEGAIASDGGFCSWVRRLVDKRRSLSQDDVVACTFRGIEASIRSGVTAIGDIDSLGVSGAWLQKSRLRAVSYREALGWGSESVLRAKNLVESFVGHDPRFRQGLSPHAPYSTDPDIYRWARSLGVPTATHIAETEEEMQFLAFGTGPLAKLVEPLIPKGLGTPKIGSSPLDYMESLECLHPEMALVHGNYLQSSADWTRLAQSRAPIIICPRSHAYFGHERHPIEGMLAAKVRMAIGTDSLASNRSLSVLDEVRWLRKSSPVQSPELLWDLVTRRGYGVLGFGCAGEISPGLDADLVAFKGASAPPKSQTPAELIEWLFDERPVPVLVMVGGIVLGIHHSLMDVLPASCRWSLSHGSAFLDFPLDLR